MLWRKGYLFRALGLLLAVVLVLGMVLPAAAAPGTLNRQVRATAGAVKGYVPGEVIVKFKNEAVKSKSFAAAAADFAAAQGTLGLKMGRTLPHGAALFKTAADVSQAVAELNKDPRVEYAQPNFIYSCCVVNDPLVSWGIADAVYGVQAETAWQYTCGNPNVVVAVLDSGVDYNHPDLQGQVIKGYDFVNNDSDPMDDNGHGTHVAGIIAAALDGKGVAGIAPGVKIMAVKVLDAGGSGTTASIVNGINYAAQHGAKVVNMSFGSYEFDRLEYDAIKTHTEILFVAAAGNGGPDGVGDDNDITPVYPANYCKENMVGGATYPALPNIVSVAALADPEGPNAGGLASFSNYGINSVGLAAPGEKISSTVPAPPADGGVALAVYDAVYGYRVMYWGFGAEDLATADAVYDSIVRTVYGFWGITPAETQTKPLLLVDDDQDGTYGTSPNQLTLPDVSSYYRNALSTASYGYTLYTVPNGADGPAVAASVYSGVVWFMGYSDDSLPGSSDINDPPNLTTADQANLIAYLQAGGRLFLSGRDAGLRIEDTPFYRDYLGAQFVTEWEGPSVMKGVYEPYTDVMYPLAPDRLCIDILKPARTGANAVLSFNPYEAWSGTSMAVPFVAGAAGLAFSLRGDLPPAEVIGILKDRVTRLPALAGKVTSGGTLNAAGALAYVKSLPLPGAGGGGGGAGGGGGGGGAPPKEEAQPGVVEITTTGKKQTVSVLDGRVTLDIPAGALPEGAKVTVELVAETPESVPAGAVAASQVISVEAAAPPIRPVTLSIRFDPARLGNLDPRALRVFRQGDNGAWEPVGGRLDRVANAVAVDLDHFSNYAVFAVRKNFADVVGHWAQKDIELLAARGVIEGTAPGVFAPERPVTRAEMAALLVKLKGLGPVAPTAPAFRDVSPGAWYYGAVETAVKAGLIKGYGDGTFRPDATLTREQLAVMVANMPGKTAAAVTAPPFADADQVSPWARDAVASVYARGLMHGVSAERFAPQAEVTRAQAAAIMARLAEEIGLFEVTTAVTGKLVLSTLEKPHWELQADGGTYVLLPDPADAATAALLRAYQGRQVTVTGYLFPGPNIYMRGPLLRVLEVILAE